MDLVYQALILLLNLCNIVFPADRRLLPSKRTVIQRIGPLFQCIQNLLLRRQLFCRTLRRCSARTFRHCLSFPHLGDHLIICGDLLFQMNNLTVVNRRSSIPDFPDAVTQFLVFLIDFGNIVCVRQRIRFAAQRIISGRTHILHDPVKIFHLVLPGSCSILCLTQPFSHTATHFCSLFQRTVQTASIPINLYVLPGTDVAYLFLELFTHFCDRGIRINLVELQVQLSPI